MCINFEAPPPDVVEEYFNTPPPSEPWQPDLWQDYQGPFIRSINGRRVCELGGYGFVPQKRKPPNVKKLTTMNARAETIGSLMNYKGPWSRSQLCLVPCMAFYEPNYESGSHQRWRIHMADNAPFAVAAMWRLWDEESENPFFTFTQVTINADEHPFMRRFHKSTDEKRSLVIVPRDQYDEWLNCRNPEMARTFLNLYPADQFTGEPAPLASRKTKAA